jgi:hypothetical protein
MFWKKSRQYKWRGYKKQKKERNISFIKKRVSKKKEKQKRKKHWTKQRENFIHLIFPLSQAKS